MIIKVATGKDKNNKIQWMPLYAAAIRNRLRRDNNLSDVTDIVAARENLGIDSNFLSVFNTFRNDITQYINEQIMKEGEDVATVLAQISDILTALTLRLSSWENALTTNWGNGDVDLDNYLYYVGEMTNFPETPKIGWTVCIDGVIYLYTGSAWVQLNGTIVSGGGSGTTEGGGGSGILPYPAIKYDNYSVPKVAETFPVFVDADQCRYRFIFPLEAAPDTERGLMISPYNPKEVHTHYVKGRFAMHGSNAVLYLPKAFVIKNNDRAMAQRVFPPEGVTGNPIDISKELVFEYTAMPPSSQYIVLRLTSTTLNSIKDTWSTANITGMRLVLDYSYAQALAVNSDVTIKTFRFVPEGVDPTSSESTMLPITDMWKMWMSDDELRLSEPSATYNRSYILNGQYPIEWQEGVHVNAQSASPPSYSYNLLQDPVVRLSDISTTTAIYRGYTNSAYANLSIASWNETTKKQNGDDIKPLVITSLPPFKEPPYWSEICQGIDEAVNDDETLISLEFEIFSHKQINKVYPLQEVLNLPVDYTQLYQWGTNEHSNFLSLYLPSDFMTKLGINRNTTFELLDEYPEDYMPKIFLLPSEYGRLYIDWALYNNTFPGTKESLRPISYIELSPYQGGPVWEPFIYVMKKTSNNEQIVISLDKKLVENYVNDLPCDIENLAFNSSGQYTYTNNKDYGTHQKNKRLLLQWKVKRKNNGYPYYYEKYMWQHVDQNSSKTTACFDAIAKTGTESVRYNKIVAPITEKNKLEDGNTAYSQITISDGDISWKMSDSSQIALVTNGDTTNTTIGIRTLSYKPVNNVIGFYSDPENLFVRLIYNKLLDHWGVLRKEDPPPPPSPPAPPPPSPEGEEEWELGKDSEYDDGFPNLLDICKYTMPSREYKFIFTLENNNSALNVGRNAYRMVDYTSDDTKTDRIHTEDTTSRWSKRIHQVSGRFMYNSKLSNESGYGGATLFLPESFFNDSIYDTFYIALRAPQRVEKYSVKMNTTTSNISGYVWLRNADDKNDKPPTDASIHSNSDPTKHQLVWSSEWKLINKKTGKQTINTPYEGYHVINIPQDTLDRITGSWNKTQDGTSTDKKNLIDLQLMISYTLKSDVFNDLGLSAGQLRNLNQQKIVRNLPLRYFHRDANRPYPLNQTAVEQAKLVLVNDFMFVNDVATSYTKFTTIWPNTNNVSKPIILVPEELEQCTVILQNKYIAKGLFNTDNHIQPQTGISDFSKNDPGKYSSVDALKLSTVNKFALIKDHGMFEDSYVWRVPNMKYSQGIDTDAYFIDYGTTPGRYHNTAMIIYDET